MHYREVMSKNSVSTNKTSCCSRFGQLGPFQILLCFLISHSYMTAQCQQSPLTYVTMSIRNTTIETIIRLLLMPRLWLTWVSLLTLLNCSFSLVPADSGNLPGRGAASCCRHETWNWIKSFEIFFSFDHMDMIYGKHNQHWKYSQGQRSTLVQCE